MAVVFKAGDFRHRVTIQRRSTTIDAVGGQSNVWTDVATVWAIIEPASGRELLAAQAMQLDQPATITLRYQPQFSDPKTMAAMRAVYGSRIFNIASVQNAEERNRILVMTCSEGLNDG